MTDNEIGAAVVDSAFQVHIALGPGLLESVYEVVLAYELRKRRLLVEHQVPIRVVYDGINFDEGVRADLIINRQVIIEIKSVEELHRVHRKQVITYLRLAKKRLGFLINFGDTTIKRGITRIVNNADDWGDRRHYRK